MLLFIRILFPKSRHLNLKWQKDIINWIEIARMKLVIPCLMIDVDVADMQTWKCQKHINCAPLSFTTHFLCAISTIVSSKQWFSRRFQEQDRLYWAFDIDEHPFLTLHSKSVYDASQCKSKFLHDFTEITMHGLTGSTYSRRSSASPHACVNGRFPPPFQLMQFGDGNVFVLSGWHGVPYRSYQPFDPAAINNHGHEKTRLAYSRSH